MQDILSSLRLAPFHLDDEAVAWVRTTLNRLSTEEKLLQLMNVPAHFDEPEALDRISACRVGGVTRFVGADLKVAWEGTRRLIEAADVPLLISGDIEGGAIGIPFATRLPNQLALSAVADESLVEQAVQVLATEARALGYNWTFTPVMDINAAFRSAIVATRSYGSDLDRIERLGRMNVRIFQSMGLAATAKHWPGEGLDDRDQHLVTTRNPLSIEEWQASYGRLYRSLIQTGVMSVMSAHIAWPAYAHAQGDAGLELHRPASVSQRLNLQLLRHELGFNGLIVSDASGMAGLGSWASRAEMVPEIVAHGCDVLLFPSPFDGDLAILIQALREGRLSEARVEEAAARVLGLKAALGLHRKTPDQLIRPLEEVRELLARPAHAACAERVASASITRVKDVKGLLPLSLEKHRRIVIITDPERSGFAGHGAFELSLPEDLRHAGFEVREHDPEHPPTQADTDLVIYLLAQESLLSRSHIYLDWARMQGDWRGAMKRYWHDIPCLLVSYGHPYYLYDAPRMPCVVNAYTATPPQQAAVLKKLLGHEAFEGRSPVDAFCGQEDARY